MRKVTGGCAAAIWAHDLPEQRVIRMTTGVVAHRSAYVLRQDLDVGEHLFDRAIRPFRPRQGLVRVVDVGLVMLVVVEPHRLLVDRRLEGVVVVWEWGYLVGHGWLLSSFKPRICSARPPKSRERKTRGDPWPHLRSSSR